MWVAWAAWDSTGRKKKLLRETDAATINHGGHSNHPEARSPTAPVPYGPIQYTREPVFEYTAWSCDPLVCQSVDPFPESTCCCLLAPPDEIPYHGTCTVLRFFKLLGRIHPTAVDRFQNVETYYI